MPEETQKLRIALGADHAGFHVKEAIKTFLESAGHTVTDSGTWSEELVDYPDYAKKVAEAVSCGEADLGILADGTGLGMAIAANKVRGIRATPVNDLIAARAAREHHNANVLTIGGRVVEPAQAVEIVRAFIAAAFKGGRHQRRNDKIAEMDGQRTQAKGTAA
jgi:ribose 5-phosphate isomerase B